MSREKHEKKFHSFRSSVSLSSGLQKSYKNFIVQILRKYKKSMIQNQDKKTYKIIVKNSDFSFLFTSLALSIQ